VELGEASEIFKEAKHPYTIGLFKSVPEPDPDKKIDEMSLTGEVPSPVNPPEGCNFNPRCPHAFDRCYKEEPELKELNDGRLIACHLYDK
jgi:oligopeptide/dipeptide ABC transporter ATP-binding protein